MTARLWRGQKIFRSHCRRQQASTRNGPCAFSFESRRNRVFLSRANPNLPKDTVRGLIAAHGARHVAQITQFQEQDYAHEAETWRVMRQHVYVIADALTTALAKQFPGKFA